MPNNDKSEKKIISKGANYTMLKDKPVTDEAYSKQCIIDQLPVLALQV